MSCLLRARFSSKKQLEAFLASTSFKQLKIFRKGERQFPKSKRITRKNIHNSVNVRVSTFRNSFFDLPKQIRQTIAFLSAYRGEVRKLSKFAGKNSLYLDFAVGADDGIMKCYRLPQKLLDLCADLNLEIEISRYAMSQERDKKAKK